MSKRLVVYLAISTIGLTSCGESPPSAPACRVKDQQIPIQPANAACIIRLDGKLLTVTHRLSGKYDVPGGTSDGSESAQCTAHRETWEETGFNVEVVKWLGENENHLHYFACTLAGNFDGSITQFPLPAWSHTEIQNIQLIDPYAITDRQWRFSERLNSLRAMFNQVEDSKNAVKPHR
ncbi:NUDIX hydrolase [Aliiglaciecola sp. LCG003]|uniref:NUDIX hydrolase n=1 Tax=Aliiglaciecola sp. LCG003 TaxID=3053655 RepID=UPI002573CCE8|nr:NUDIX hydrolase [Aliiglaciecola sp. LCG003]WJG08789.1 NUDIX hydrolase [Aliiglaciecola sp. LCG003]